MKNGVFILSLLLIFSCRKDKVISLPVDFECHYGNLIFSSDTSINIPAFYQVKMGNYWNYTTKKYVNDTLDTSYSYVFSRQITGTLRTLFDTLWQMNNNSDFVYGKHENSIFYLENSSTGCKFAQTYFYIPTGTDTLVVYIPNGSYPWQYKCYNSTDTVVTPSGTFYNPVIREGASYGYYHKTYFIKNVGMVKHTSQQFGSPIVLETLLESYFFN